MRGLIWLAAVALAATACGGSDESEAAPTTPSATVTERTLAETCPLLEQATPTGLMPSDNRLATYAAKLSEFATLGDAETRNALKPMRAAVEATRTAEPGSDAAAAFEDWTAALGVLAERCNAVGSGAFQG